MNSNAQYILIGSDLKTYKITASVLLTCEQIKELARKKFGIYMLRIESEKRLNTGVSNYYKKKLSMSV